MSSLSEKYTQEINLVRQGSLWVIRLLSWVRSLLIAGTLMGVWGYLRPGEQAEQLVLAGLTLFMGILLSNRRKLRPVSVADLLLSLEIMFPDQEISPLRYKDEGLRVPEAAGERMRARLWQVLREELRHGMTFATSLVLPALLFIFVVQQTPETFAGAMEKVSSVVAHLRAGSTLTVLDGKSIAASPDVMDLSASGTKELELLSTNLLKLEVRGLGDAPSVELRKVIPAQAEPGPVFQTFQLMDDAANQDSGTKVYNVSFSVSDDVALYLTNLSRQTPAAKITVRQLPVPKVRLVLLSPRKDPWPDDKPLQLRIDVRAENPLQLIKLKIFAEGKTHEELVTRVMGREVSELSENYDLFLESYLQLDLSEIEVVAEAIDRATPNPLIGRSEPLKIKTASAYGRYQKALNSLSEIREHLEKNVSTGSHEVAKEALSTSQRLLDETDDSPFFDGLDRVKINQFHDRLTFLGENPDMAGIMELSSDINDFLFEHESLDDRERDRDFFVSARALSRLLEKPVSNRPLTVGTLTGSIKPFLEGRHKRWQLRVDRLPPARVPQMWQQIRAGPFRAAMDRIAELAAKQTKQDDRSALSELASTVGLYREWIEALEAAEDGAREEMEQERQQGIANARQVLKELQKRQGAISTILDKSATKDPAELADKWPSTRMKQNTNVSEAGKLEAQLRSFSPPASERIRLARDAMRSTIEMGAESQFVPAESYSDVAGRLLRQADSAARKSQQRKQRRGRRKRVTTDNYYGKSIIRGDVELKREYKVDRRYREDILKDLKNQPGSKEDKLYLENYMREIIR